MVSEGSGSIEEILRLYRSSFIMNDKMLAATEHLNSMPSLTINQKEAAHK